MIFRWFLIYSRHKSPSMASSAQRGTLKDRGSFKILGPQNTFKRSWIHKNSGSPLERRSSKEDLQSGHKNSIKILQPLKTLERSVNALQRSTAQRMSLKASPSIHRRPLKRPTSIRGLQKRHISIIDNKRVFESQKILKSSRVTQKSHKRSPIHRSTSKYVWSTENPSKDDRNPRSKLAVETEREGFSCKS